MKAVFRCFWIFRILVLSILLLEQAALSPAEAKDRQAVRISDKVEVPHPPYLETEPKTSCILERHDGVALTYFPNYDVGDKDCIYLDPQQCGVPYPFPFQATGVEFLLFNHAGVDSARVRFSISSVGSDVDEGPQDRLWTSTTYTVKTFYPDWTVIEFGKIACVSEPFFLAMEYSSGEVTTIPSLVSDDQQDMVDDFFQWVWLAEDSPPWYEWNDFWNDPHPGWLMLRLAGETYSLTCDTGWVWLNDNAYAPSGAPDIDASQAGWAGRCGPASAANCLEWFGVNANLGWDIPQFVDSLAVYMQSDSSGSEVHQMKSGVDGFLNDFALTGLNSSLWPTPEFQVMAESLEVSQTIVLLLGFWWYDGESWWREGGHFVTLSGVNPQALKIALSDPGEDAAENDWPGRVRPSDHPSPPHGDTLHNDPTYVSHDIYQCSLESPGPGNPLWQLTNYLEMDPDLPRQYTGMNFPSEFASLFQSAPEGTTFVAEVEYAFMICTQQEHMFWEVAHQDYAPSGMPDIDQKQESWVNIGTGQFTFCGPAAVADCFWWMDSKFNVPAGTMGDGSDQFPLVRDYLDDLTPFNGWDDHDLWNINHSTTLWTGVEAPPETPQPFTPGPQAPGGVGSWGELVERLAWQLDTDGERTTGSHVGTKVQDLEDALDGWFAGETFSAGGDLSDSMCVRIYQKPTFSLVDTLVLQRGNVILLLGFWFSEANKWRRVGGHYVVVAGINPVQTTIAFSDPFFDNAENGASGRVLSGSYIPHTPIPHSDSTLHNDPGNVSHDMYYPDLNFSNTGGIWQIPDYAVYSDLDSLMDCFYQQNVPEEFESYTQPYSTGLSVNTVVEYAILIDELDYRGDINGDGLIQLNDVLFLLNYLFRGGGPPTPLYSGDLNCDGLTELGDVIVGLNYLFREGPVSRCCGP
jgi:hypothetical protein